MRKMIYDQIVDFHQEMNKEQELKTTQKKETKKVIS